MRGPLSAERLERMLAIYGERVAALHVQHDVGPVPAEGR